MLFCATILVTLLAVAEAGPPSDNRHLSNAIRLIGELEEERALVELERAAAQSAADPATLCRVYLYRGIAHGGLVNGPAAVESFRAALALNPGVELPQTSERIAGWFEDARHKAGLPRRPRPTMIAEPSRPAPVHEQAPALAARPAPSPAAPRLRLYLGGALLLGAAASAGAGGYFVVQANREDERWREESDVGAAQVAHRSARQRATTANVLFGAAAALGAGGGVLLVFEL